MSDDIIFNAGSGRVRLPAGISPIRAGAKFLIRGDGTDVVLRLMRPVDPSTDPDGVTHEVIADVEMHRDQFEKFVKQLVKNGESLRRQGYRVGPNPN